MLFKRDCGPRRSPGLAALRASILPASGPNDSRNTVGGLRSPALQSRGGDGWRFFEKIPRRTLRLPVHEVRDDWVGQIRPLWVTESRKKFPRREKTKPGFQVCTCLRQIGLQPELRPRSRHNAHAGSARRAQLHGELCLKNLLEQISLVHARRRANAQALAPLHEDNLVRVLADQL